MTDYGLMVDGLSLANGKMVTSHLHDHAARFQFGASRGADRQGKKEAASLQG